MATPKIKNRTIAGDKSRDPSSIELLTYNEKAGARKSLTVGPALIPVPTSSGFSTDASVAPLALPAAGTQLAIFNKSATTAFAATVGDSSMTAQAIGGIQTTASGTFVGVPVAPNSWLYLSSAQWTYIATNSNNLVVFIIDDDTYIVTQPANNAST